MNKEMKNLMKEKLANNKIVYGPWITTSDLDSALILSAVGCDLVMIDGEHGDMGLETLGRIITQYRGSKTTPLYRVPWNDLATVKRALDMGPQGIMFPMICSKEEAERAVSYCKYPPLGVRGAVMGSRASLFGVKMKEYMPSANEEILIIAQIEHVKALENLDDIITVPGINVAFFGPFDLSLSMGIPGELDHPRIDEARKKLISCCKKHNVIPASVTEPRTMQKDIEMGFKILIGGIDSQFIFNGAKAMLDQFTSLTNQ